MSTVLATSDLADFNLRQARGLPGAENLDIPHLLRTLDEWALRVQCETQRVWPIYQRNPEKFNNSPGQFRAEVLVTVLQRDVGLRYRKDSLQMSDHEFWSRPENVFIHGPIQTRLGTCASLPVIYVGVGRRLGYPMKLATTFQHLFARWDDPQTGERFNIECTSQGFVSNPDNYYLRWPKELTEQQVNYYRATQSLTPIQEQAHAINNRSTCLHVLGKINEAAVVKAAALALDPTCPWLQVELQRLLNEWDRVVYKRLMPGFPPMRIHPPLTRLYPNIPWEAEKAIYHLSAKELVLDNPEAEQRWWGPLRRNPGSSPHLLPAFVTVKLPRYRGDGIVITFHEVLPADYNLLIAQPC